MVFTKLLLAWVFGPDLYCTSSSSSSSSCSLWKPSWQRRMGPDYCKTRGAWFPRFSSVAPIIYIYRAAGAEDLLMFCCCIPSSFCLEENYEARIQPARSLKNWWFRCSRFSLLCWVTCRAACWQCMRKDCGSWEKMEIAAARDCKQASYRVPTRGSLCWTTQDC